MNFINGSTSLRQRVARCAAGGLALILAVGLIGCQQTKKPEEPAATASLKESIQQADPGSMVGEVIYTLADRPYTAVNDVDIAKVKVGQTVSFIDASGKPINNGSVVAIVGDDAHVRFDPMGKRRPQKGDLAVWLTE
jgi:hypothetical protein